MTTRDTMPAARILHVDDQPETHEWLKLALERKGYEVTVATDGHSALASFTTHRPDIVLLDHELPDQNGLDVLRQLKNADPLVEVVMLTGHGSVSLAVEAMREGAFNFVEKPVEFAVLEAVLDKALSHRNLHAEAARLRMSAERRDGLGRLVGTSPAMRRLFDLIQLVAPTDASVLIRGENGTGKELVARTLHHLSPACRQPFVRVGPAARSLEEHVALVNGGTLFLDDLGEWPLELQDQLLEALSAHEGESPEVEVNLQGARMIAAISGDLSASIEVGRLRETLSRRLAAFSIALPPLRARDGDIELLAQAFLERYSKRSGRWFAPLDADDAARLRGYGWPGNVRELQNVIERALLLSRGPRLDLARAMPSEATWESSPRVLSSSGRTEATILTALELRELERENLRRAVLACDGRIAGPSGAAAKLGLPPTTVASQVKALGLQRVRRARVSRTR